VLRSCEERAGYLPDEQIATYREVVRLHAQLSEEVARYQNQIQALVVVLFASRLPRSLPIPACPLRWRCGTAYPHAQLMAQAGVEAVYQVLRAVPATHFGRPTAEK